MSESSSVNSEVWDYLEKILVFVECVPKLRARNGVHCLFACDCEYYTEILKGLNYIIMRLGI